MPTEEECTPLLPTLKDLEIRSLGPATIPSPLLVKGNPVADESDRVLLASTTSSLEPGSLNRDDLPSFEPGGARAKIYFDPAKTCCGIVTCGGLCPGLNDVIRSVVLTLYHHYGVHRVLGFRYGYAGLTARPLAGPMELTPANVNGIHEYGGTILGSSRGPQSPEEMIETLLRHRISILFAVGGDGTLRGASKIAEEALKRGLALSIIGIPKTIDNDIQWVVRSFGFSTAVECAKEVLRGAHEEARGTWNGVGLVKLMGRDSGFIAANATLSSADVNFCLVPEAPFALDGEGGFLAALERRLHHAHHAVVAVAEGAGKNLIDNGSQGVRDASGNVKFPDIGSFLRDRIRGYFKAKHIPVDVKYIDPSYTIRSVPANALDSELCLMLGQQAVHAGMAGRTDMMVGYWNQRTTHVPIAMATHSRKLIDPRGVLWQRVLETTGQPIFEIDKVPALTP